MGDKLSRPMFIYVSGPYSAPDEPDAARRNKVEANIRKADEVAVAIAKKGHVPFVPHSMMDKWEAPSQLGREQAMELCYQWVRKCDALYYIGSSPGADKERDLAKQHNIPIYRSLDDVPDASDALRPSLSPEAREAYLVEYQECMDSYRHTYATVWQAGSIFAAISAAIVAFTKGSGTPGSPVDIAPWIQMLAPLPFLFWWWGVFIPMDRYGELRRDRLADIEKLLNEPTTPGLKMQHFIKFRGDGEDGSGRVCRIVKRIITLKWVWRPRVKDVVTIFGAAVLMLEILLVRKHWQVLKDLFTQ